jgi:hypothetical protein
MKWTVRLLLMKIRWMVHIGYVYSNHIFLLLILRFWFRFVIISEMMVCTHWLLTSVEWCTSYWHSWLAVKIVCVSASKSWILKKETSWLETNFVEEYKLVALELILLFKMGVPNTTRAFVVKYIAKLAAYFNLSIKVVLKKDLVLQHHSKQVEEQFTCQNSNSVLVFFVVYHHIVFTQCNQNNWVVIFLCWKNVRMIENLIDVHELFFSN